MVVGARSRPPDWCNIYGCACRSESSSHAEQHHWPASLGRTARRSCPAARPKFNSAILKKKPTQKVAQGLPCVSLHVRGCDGSGEVPYGVR